MSPATRSTGLRILIACLLAGAALFYLWTAGSADASVRPAKDLTGYYNRLADSFLAGRVSLLQRPSLQLLSLPDPYDPKQNAPYRLHDAALYHGRFYLYYGPSPVLVAFAPFRRLTGLHLPEPVAVAAGCWMGLLFSFLLLEYLTRLYLPRTPYWLLAAAVPALAFGNIAPFLMRRPQHYEVAIASGYAFAFAGLFFLATGALGPRVRLGRLLAGGVLLGLAIGARFPMIATVLVPMVLAAWLVGSRRCASAGRCIAAALAMFGPIAVSLFLLGLYNKTRFGSWTDFGLRYTLQGLVSAREYKFFDPQRAPWSFLYYVFVPPRVSAVFPFVRLQPDTFLPPPPGYVLERVAGIVPMVPLVGVLFLLPALVRRLWRSNRGVLASVATLCGVGGALLGLFCMSAGTMRYEVDFATFFLVPALLLWFTGLVAFRSSAGQYATAVTVFVLLLTTTVALNAAISLTGYYDNLQWANPPVYEAIHAVFRPLERVMGGVR